MQGCWERKWRTHRGELCGSSAGVHSGEEESLCPHRPLHTGAHISESPEVGTPSAEEQVNETWGVPQRDGTRLLKERGSDPVTPQMCPKHVLSRHRPPCSHAVTDPRAQNGKDTRWKVGPWLPGAGLGAGRGMAAVGAVLCAVMRVLGFDRSGGCTAHSNYTDANVSGWTVRRGNGRPRSGSTSSPSAQAARFTPAHRGPQAWPSHAGVDPCVPAPACPRGGGGLPPRPQELEPALPGLQRLTLWAPRVAFRACGAGVCRAPPSGLLCRRSPVASPGRPPLPERPTLFPCPLLHLALS